MDHVHLRRMGGKVIEVEFSRPESQSSIYVVDLKTKRVTGYTSYSNETQYREYEMDEPVAKVQEVYVVLLEKNLID